MANNKIIYDGNTLIDLSGDSVTPENVDAGVTFHGPDGEPQVGTRSGEGGGSGGGGLPEGVSALASGIIAPTSNITSDYSVAHGLGKKPDFAILMLLDDAATTPLKSTQLFQLLSHKPFSSNGSVYYTRGLVAYQSSSGSTSNAIVSLSDASYATETTIKFRALSNQPLKAGYTYRWVCGVLS